MLQEIAPGAYRSSNTFYYDPEEARRKSFSEFERENIARHEADPTWYPSNTNSAVNFNQDTRKKLLAEQLLLKKQEQDNLNFARQTLQQKIAKGDLFQNDVGDWQEIYDEMDPTGLGGLRKTIGPIRLETASLLAKIGGPEQLGFADKKQMLALQAFRNRTKPPTNPESGSVPINNFPNQTIGILGKLENLIYQNQLENPESVTTLGDVGNAVKNYYGNVGTSIFGGEYRSIDQGGRVIKDERDERTMIDLLRTRKGLRPITDEQWTQFLINRGRGANRPILNQ